MLVNLDDARVRDAKFVNAPAIFPNNDIKYEVTKKRAGIFAASKGEAVTWSPAKDCPSSAVLSDKPNIVEEKLGWLQRHDKDCGSLYGMLPLVVGMPVALADHIDRNPEKNLLRGRIGHIISWTLDEREDSVFHDNKRILRYLPAVVLVQFTERVRVNDEWVEKPCNWTVDGIDRPGVYPIFPCRRHWFLDERRKPSKLRVIRHQLPLMPAYAMTAHCTQGRTLPAAIIDLQIGRGVNGIASYVAMTRMRKKTDLLIFRPFDREVFAAGPPLGPSLLLQHLKGEFIDWKQIEEDHIPSKFCHGPCRSMRLKDEFGKEWSNKIDPHCSACMEN